MSKPQMFTVMASIDVHGVLTKSSKVVLGFSLTHRKLTVVRVWTTLWLRLTMLPTEAGRTLF